MEKVWRDFWNEKYSAAESLYGTEPLPFLRESLSHLKPGGRVLLPADGEGRNGVYLATEGFDVHTFDGSEVAVQKSRQDAADRGVIIHATVSSVADFGFPTEEFDGVISSYFHLQPYFPQLHQKYISCLKPGGVFLLEGFSKDQMNYDSGGPREKDMLFTQEGLREDFKDFDILMMEEKVEMLNSGTRHKGEGSVIRMIAKKPE